MSDNKQWKDEHELKKTLTPLHLWAIGVGIVISGNYFGWNFGLAAGGFWGMFVATVLMAIMYATMTYTITELSTMLPHAGGPYSFARRAMGPTGGFLTGVGVVLEYGLAAPVVAIGVGGYVNWLFPDIPLMLTAIVIFIFFIWLHYVGIKEYALVETVIVFIALGLLVLLYIFAFPKFEAANLVLSPGEMLPFGTLGIWAAIPYAMWFYLAIEMLPMMCEECKDPVRDMPKGLNSTIITLLILSFLTLTLVAGIGGVERMGVSEFPLPEAAAIAFGEGHWLAWILATVGLTGLLASFSGVILAYSRQIFALARAGYIPTFLAKLHPKRRTPYWALILPGFVGIVLVQFVGADYLILVATFGALVSYIMMNLSCIILRTKEPNMERPYRVPGYPFTPWISLILAFLALFASIFYAWQWFIVSVVVFALAYFYFMAVGRHNIIASAPEEEAAIRAAQQELDG